MTSTSPSSARIETTRHGRTPGSGRPGHKPTFLQGWWHEIATIGPDAGGHWHAVRVSLSVTVPLSVLLALGHPEWTGPAVFGSLSSVYGKRYKYPDRMRAQLGAGAALTVAVLLGAITAIGGPGSLWPVGLMSALSVFGFVISRRFGWLPVPSLFLVFAAGTVSSHQQDWNGVWNAAVLAALSALFGVGIGQIGRLFPGSGTGTIAAPLPTPLWNILRAPGARAQMLQYAIGPLLAGSLATALGLGHPYWAAVSATVPLIGTTLAAQLGRGTLRLLGTVFGIGIAAALIELHPPVWLLVCAVAVFQVIIELFVARNYGIAVVCITPAALILSHLATPTHVGGLVVDRLIETGIGIFVAAMVLVIPQRSRRRRTEISGGWTHCRVPKAPPGGRISQCRGSRH